jgi:hypothetical protein
MRQEFIYLNKIGGVINETTLVEKISRLSNIPEKL